VAGVGTESADSVDAIAFNLRRVPYIWQIAFNVVMIIWFAAFLLAGQPPLFVFLIFVIGLVVPALAIASALKILSLPNPILSIDRHGVFDRRVTREVVPWTKIRGFQLMPMYWSSIRVDVGNRRHAGIDLTPWTYFGAFRYGTIAWDDVVISPYGLAVDPHPGRARLANLIVSHAEALRARHASAQGRKV
jgi:hypothetical protein